MPTQKSTSNLEELNKQIYEHSLELAIVNKTLSLLRKLYQISLQALEPASISEKISEIIRLDLNMELVGILAYESKTDSLTPFKFSVSDRLAESEKSTNLTLDKIKVIGASKKALFEKAIAQKTVVVGKDLKEIWGGLVESGNIEKLSTDSHIQTVIVDPLITEDKVIGAIVLGLNREYSVLSDFEKDSIKSFIDVVAVALDKALLYQQLADANSQLQALDKARAEFITIASHQLRTPPSTIKWYLNSVLAGDFGELSPEVKAALERTNVTNEIQISTISDLLNASRIERGKLEFFFQEDNIEPIVKSLVDQLEPLSEMHKQHLVYHKPAATVPNIMMDQEKIRQVINNMIDNAIKYSKQGDIEVSLEVDDEFVSVRVKDHGKGMPPEEVHKLFQKYVRGQDSATHATGLGLGMYVAKVIIDQHNGKIWAESPGLGQGSTFAFSLPIHSSVKATSVVDLTKEMA